MPYIGEYNERSYFTGTVTPLDEDKLPTAPTTLRYRIDCQTTGATLTEWTELVPAADVRLTIGASKNAILDDSNERETKVLTVEANYETDLQVSEEFSWTVRNLYATR